MEHSSSSILAGHDHPYPYYYDPTTSTEAAHLELLPLIVPEEFYGSRILQEQGQQPTEAAGYNDGVAFAGTNETNAIDSNPTLFSSSGAGGGSSIGDATYFNATSFNDTVLNDTIAPTWAPSKSYAPSWYPSEAPTPKPTRPGLIESTDTAVLRNTIEVYGSIYLGLTALFCVLRKLYPRLFNIRGWVKDLQCEIAMTSSYGWLSWMWEVFEEDDDDILEQCGMDALCFVRVLRIGRKLSLVGCFHAIWLIPVYKSAEESPETSHLTDTLVLISTAALPSESPRFLATILAAYTIFGYAMWLIRQELEWYTEKRHQFISQRRPRNYAVYVAGIPEHLRSGPQLAEFFRQSGATSAVLEAHVTLSCPELESLVAQRDAVLARFEHAKAKEAIRGSRETKVSLNLLRLAGFGTISRSGHSLKSNASPNAGGFVATVDYIEHLERKIRELTKDIAIAYQYIERANDPYSWEQHREIVMQEIEDLRRAERAQNIATRERVHSCHDLEQAEEIYHVPDQDPSIPKPRRTEDRFSRAAEAFFFGDLTPKQKQEQEREHQRLLAEEEPPPKQVTIHTSQNSIHSATMTETPSFESEDERANRQDIFRAPCPPPPRIITHAFPSKSTITTIPGTFDPHTGEWTRQNSFDGSHDSHIRRYNNQYFQNPRGDGDMPYIEEDMSSSGSDDSRYENALDAARLRLNNVDESESDELKDSRASWSTGASKALRRVSVHAKKLGDVGKFAVETGAGAAVSATKQSMFLGKKVSENVAGNLKKQGLQAAELGVENINMIRATAAAVVPMVMHKSEGMPLEAGFVVFKNLYATQAALQMLHHSKAGVMRATEAPGPDEIYWRNVGLPESGQRTGRLLSLAATVTLCLFWTAPVSFISALTEVNSLKAKFTVLAQLVEKYPAMENVLALIAPLLLLILQDLVLPEFLRWFAAWEGHISSSALEAAVFVKYAAFVLVQTFFVSAISGSIAAELENMINQPEKFIDFLANALPAQSNYFLQILVVSMVATMSTELLRVYPLGMALARKFFGPNLTEKERTKTWKFLSPLEDPPEFDHANYSGTVCLFFMVYFVYACLAPISSIFLVVCFFMMENGYRYQLYHNYPPKPDSGGKYWVGFFHILQAEIIVAQLTLIGFLLLKKSFYAMPFMIPLMVFTILFIMYLNNQQLQVTKFLPTSECVKVDKVYRLADVPFKGVYLQPCIAAAQSDEIFEII